MSVSLRNRRWLQRLGALGVLAVVVTACGGGVIEGSGTIVDDVRPVTSFDEIHVRDGVNVQVIVDPGAAAQVIVHYDDNIVGEIITEVGRETLEIGLDATVSLDGVGRRFVEVTLPRLVGVEASGGARLVGIGTVPTLDVRASGGASVDLGSLANVEVTVDLSGGANATVNATGAVRGDASGGARLLVVGGRAVIAVDTSGGASVAEG